jgi:predicted ATPase
VQLFIHRASSVDKPYVLSEADAEVIAKIVTRLDGIPLAIELAAARLAILTPQQLLDRLSSRFSVLRARHSTTDRHQTLKKAMSHRYNRAM